MHPRFFARISGLVASDFGDLTLSITDDNDSSPAVWFPLDDFFAYVGGADKFQSLPVGLLDDGTLYSYWYMHFAIKAHIEIGNDGNSPVPLTIDISHAPLTQPIQSLARFHAKWHRDAFPTTCPDRFPDWTLLTTTSQGRYVGTHLAGWNPRGNWWGEGDDKFFVDGEKFPSSFGTGSDPYTAMPVADRIGYWTRPDIYHEPGAIEAESLRPATKAAQPLRAQEMWAFGKQWSNDEQLYWTPTQSGQSVELIIPPQKPGKYHLLAHFTKAHDYGIFQLNLNGTDISQPIDLYSPELKTTDPIDLGVVTLPEGKPILKVTLAGKNAASSASSFGLDYLKLVPQP